MITAAVIVAGGRGNRLGGVDKPGLTVAGRSLLDRALESVPGAQTVVVGPKRVLPPGVSGVLEDPPGSGPASAIVAGLAALPVSDGLVAVVAADLPGVSVAVVRRLADAVQGGPGAILTDPSGGAQWLLGVWRQEPLRAAVAIRGSWVDASVRSLLAPLNPVLVPALADEHADLDTPEDRRSWEARLGQVFESPDAPATNDEPGSGH